MHVENYGQSLNNYGRMVEDAFRLDSDNVDETENAHDDMSEPPNPEAQRFYDLLEAAQRPLWPGCTNNTELSVAARIMSIKSDYNVPQKCVDEFASLMKEICPPES